MTRRTKIRTAHVTAATVAFAFTDAWTSYAQTQSHHTTSGAWTNQLVFSWVVLVLTGLWVVVWGCYGLHRLVRSLWRAGDVCVPQGRPAPGTGNRKPSLTAEEWAATEAIHRHVRQANAAARHQQARDGMEDTAVMYLAEADALYAEEPQRPMLIDAIQAHGLTPTYVAGAAAVTADQVMEHLASAIAEAEALIGGEAPVTARAEEPVALAAERDWFTAAWARQTGGMAA